MLFLLWEGSTLPCMWVSMNYWIRMDNIVTCASKWMSCASPNFFLHCPKINWKCINLLHIAYYAAFVPIIVYFNSHVSCVLLESPFWLFMPHVSILSCGGFHQNAYLGSAAIRQAPPLPLLNRLKATQLAETLLNEVSCIEWYKFKESFCNLLTFFGCF